METHGGKCFFTIARHYHLVLVKVPAQLALQAYIIFDDQ